MLIAHSETAPPASLSHAHAAGDAVWLDLIDATEEERALAERASGLRVPARTEISEIESSSRLRVEGAALYLSMPVLSKGNGGPGVVSALGFVLSPERLLTVRFTRLSAFDSYAEQLPHGGPPIGSVGVFVGLLEATIDRLADVLEHVGAELDMVSGLIFHDALPARRTRSRRDAALRATLRRIGQAGDLVSHLRDGLLGVSRIVHFVAETAAAWIPEGLRSRFATLREDIASLNDYDAQLTNKVQFLLDATLGFLNIEQNNGIKVLTVVSIVGIPPTLIASIYGMNFKNMPELNWAWGYPYGLTLIVLSVALPLLWFKIKGWL